MTLVSLSPPKDLTLFRSRDCVYHVTGIVIALDNLRHGKSLSFSHSGSDVMNPLIILLLKKSQN